jgi:hypothetical protein
MSVRKLAVALCASLCAALGAGAATLSIVPDKTTYAVGEPVIVQIVGDPQGASANALFGRLRFDPTLLSPQGLVPLTPSSGGVPWVLGALGCDTGFCAVMDAIRTSAPALVDQSGSQVWATVTLQATAPGTMNLSMETQVSTGYQLDFFGQTSTAPVQIQVTAAPVIPSVDQLDLALLTLLLTAGAAWALRRRARVGRA